MTAQVLVGYRRGVYVHRHSLHGENYVRTVITMVEIYPVEFDWTKSGHSKNYNTVIPCKLCNIERLYK